MTKIFIQARNITHYNYGITHNQPTSNVQKYNMNITHFTFRNKINAKRKKNNCPNMKTQTKQNKKEKQNMEQSTLVCQEKAILQVFYV